MGRLATSVVGPNRPLKRSAQYPWKQSSGRTQRRIATKWMQCNRRFAAFMKVFGAIAGVIDSESLLGTA
jgi:hypothetical protein